MSGYRAYKFRIYPDAKQEIVLRKIIGCSRKIYNLMLADRQELYSLFKTGSIDKDTFKLMSKDILPSKYKKMEEYDYLKEADASAFSCEWTNLNSSYTNFFKDRAAFPKFKSKNKDKWSYRTLATNNNIRFVENDKCLKLPKVGNVRIKKHRATYGKLKSATITLERSGKWYVSVLFDEGNYDYVEKLPSTGSVVGLDLGVKELAIDSNGNHYANPKFAYKYSKQLTKEQRKLSKMYSQWEKEGKPCKLSERKNYQKQKLKVARIQEKIRNCRKNNLNQFTSMMVKNHDIICVESLNVIGMAKNHKLARAVYDTGMGELIRQLEYKCARNDKVLVKIDRFFASTQMCHNCKNKTGAKGLQELNVREWTCSECSARHDRDENAALNIVDEGLRIFFEQQEQQELEKQRTVGTTGIACL